jgi:hypothetical protein
MGGEADSPGIDATLAFGTASAPLTGGVLDRPQLISHPKAALRGCPLLFRFIRYPPATRDHALMDRNVRADVG